MKGLDAEVIERDVREVARLKGISNDKAIAEIVALYAPIYIKQLKEELGKNDS